jgi:hypothetical protein
MRKRSAGRRSERGLGLASALLGALAAGPLAAGPPLAPAPSVAGAEAQAYCANLLEARRAQSAPAPPAPESPAPPPDHPGLTFHRLPPYDTYDYHQYDYTRHQHDKLAGTSRLSRAGALFGMEHEGAAPQAEPEATLPAALPAEPPEAAEQRAWQLLRLGDAAEARRVFTPLTGARARTALPSVGLALAAAESGDLVRGVSAMRRAFLDDAEIVRCAPIDPRMRARLLQLVERYSERPGGEPDGRDADFMRAALYYLLEELSAAEVSIDRAIHEGDQSPSATGLQREVQRRLFEAL